MPPVSWHLSALARPATMAPSPEPPDMPDTAESLPLSRDSVFEVMKALGITTSKGPGPGGRGRPAPPPPGGNAGP
jgi:hypothetical protein